MAQKATKAETRKRIDLIEQMIVDGASRAEMLRYARENWNIGVGGTERLMTYARKRIDKVLEASEQDFVADAVRRYLRIYAKALKAGEFGAARQTIKDMCHLLGLNKPIRIEVKDVTELTDEQIEGEIARLLGKTKVTRPTEGAGAAEDAEGTRRDAAADSEANRSALVPA